MIATRLTYIVSMTAFLLGFALGGLSLHVASAQGLFGLKTSVSQIGSALVEMQKNVDDLQKNMGTIKQAKDQLSSLSSTGGEGIKKEEESIKNSFLEWANSLYPMRRIRFVASRCKRRTLIGLRKCTSADIAVPVSTKTAPWDTAITRAQGYSLRHTCYSRLGSD